MGGVIASFSLLLVLGAATWCSTEGLLLAVIGTLTAEAGDLWASEAAAEASLM